MYYRGLICHCSPPNRLFSGGRRGGCREQLQMKSIANESSVITSLHFSVESKVQSYDEARVCRSARRGRGGSRCGNRNSEASHSTS